MANVHKRDKYQLAYRLFMDTGMTQKEIAEYVDIQERTLTEWKQKGEWEIVKSAHSVTTNEIIAGYLKQLKNLKDEINSRKEKRYPTPGEADTITKVTKSIRTLQRDLTLSNYITAHTELLKFVFNVKPELVKELSALVREFVHIKAKELAKS